MDMSRGRHVAHRRVARNLTQEDLARLCGCSLRTIQRIESDVGESITSVMIRALRRHLGRPPLELGAAARRGKGA